MSDITSLTTDTSLDILPLSFENKILESKKKGAFMGDAFHCHAENGIVWFSDKNGNREMIASRTSIDGIKNNRSGNMTSVYLNGVEVLVSTPFEVIVSAIIKTPWPFDTDFRKLNQ